MNKQQRRKWLGLTVIKDYDLFSDGSIQSLCLYCKHLHINSTYDNYSGTTEHEPECLKNLNINNVLDGADCWGFIPKIKFEIAAEDYCTPEEAELVFDMKSGAVLQRKCVFCDTILTVFGLDMGSMCFECSHKYLNHREILLKGGL